MNRNSESNGSAARLTNLIVFCFVALAIQPHHANADTIWIKGQSASICGRVIAADELKIVFRYHANSKRDSTASGTVDIERSQIEMLVQNIDSGRLANLSPDRPEEYRLYAEELSSQVSDWEARDLAVRLYLIAAAHSRGQEQQSALNGLVAVARSRNEKRKFEMLRFLTAKTQQSLPSFKTNAAGPRNSLGVNQRVLQLVQSIRQGEGARALQLMGRADVQTALVKWESICTLPELNRMARANRPPLSGLIKLMEIERQLSETLAGAVPNPNPFFEDASWAGQSTEIAVSLSLPDLNSATEFDPRRPVFIEGQWTTVEEKTKRVK